MTRPLPIVPEDYRRMRPDVAEQRRSLHRAVAAIVLAREGDGPEEFLRRAWDDPLAGRILKAATSPTSTTNSGLPGVSTVGLFRLLAPSSSAIALFDRATSVDLARVTTVNVPSIATLPGVLFVGEGAPIPATNLNFSSVVVGPVKKLAIISGLSEELETASPEVASNIIGRILASAVTKGLDTIALGTGAGDATTPSGLLHSVVPITASAAGATAMADDLGALAASIAAAGIDTSDLIYIASPREATIIKVEASPKFDNLVLSSPAMPPKSVAAFAPAAVISGFGDSPQIEKSKQATVHFETSPQQISGSPGAIASPVFGTFQQALIAVRCIGRVAWACEPGGGAVVNSVNW